jgi:3',5'-cyclic AMP phosphodiesterase CpdA
VETPLCFVNLTDLHYSSQAKEDGMNLSRSMRFVLPGVVQALNRREDLDFVALTGDLVSGPAPGNLETVRDCLEPLKVPYYVIPGNHDIPGKNRHEKGEASSFESVFQGHGPEPGQAYWSLDPKAGWHLIGLDSTIRGDWKGKISREQLQWLEEDLDNNRDKNIVVLCHHNLLAHHPWDRKGPWKGYVAGNAEKVRGLLETVPSVRLVVTGHHHLCAGDTWKGIPYITCPALTAWPCRYSRFVVNPKGIDFSTHPIPFPELLAAARKNLLAFQPFRKRFPPGPAGDEDMLRMFLGPEQLFFSLSPVAPAGKGR